jgi:tetrapyrrole methylase family protein/MazG family protein
MKKMLKDKYSFEDLIEIMALLRSREGCPWDREQTHESLKRYLIEETYEVLEAIDLKDKDKLCEELGDLMLQILFHAQIASEKGEFDIGSVITGISRKMVLRHTHVFGTDKAETANDVIDSWEKIKKKEKGAENQTKVLKDVPSNLPALMRSYKVQEKAAQVGFDWEKAEDAFKKVEEEIQELKDVYTGKNVERITDEMGDAFFALVNVCRFVNIQPELALTGTTEKFIKRFEYIEQQAAREGKKLEEMSLAEMDRLWDRAKIQISEECHS